MSLRPGKDDDKSIITDMNKIIDHVNVGGFSSCASYLIHTIQDIKCYASYSILRTQSP